MNENYKKFSMKCIFQRLTTLGYKKKDKINIIKAVREENPSFSDIECLDYIFNEIFDHDFFFEVEPLINENSGTGGDTQTASRFFNRSLHNGYIKGKHNLECIAKIINDKPELTLYRVKENLLNLLNKCNYSEPC